MDRYIGLGFGPLTRSLISVGLPLPMPYIKQEKRNKLYDCQLEALGVYCDTPGDLNFVFTIIIAEYFKRRKNYQAVNDILGALEGAKQEFYRRVAVPYEDLKIKENGDVYT